MAKKFALLSIVAALLAFAAPSFASAATGLTEGGKLVPVGKTVTLTNSTAFVLTSSSFGNITCATGSVMIDGLLTTNTAAEVQAAQAANSYNASCSTGSGGTVPFKNFRLNFLKTIGGGSGSYSLSFDLPLGSEGEVVCKYTSSGNFTYNPSQTAEGSNAITITKQPTTVTPPACGSSASINGTFKLATGGTSTSLFLM